MPKRRVNVEIDSATFRRLDAAMERRRREIPGFTVSRSDILRGALLRFLDADEKEIARSPEAV